MASLPTPLRQEVFRRLNVDQIDFLLWDWNYRARDSQMPPPGDWRCWLFLGDARCTIALTDAAFHGTGAVIAANDARRFTVSGLDAFANAWFAGGKLAWTSGANAGRAMDVKRHAVSGTNVTIELWQPMSESLAPGDAFAITAGCDKQFATCKAKFANAANFRGQPYMIGNDAVIAYPTQRAPLDGGSRYGN